MGVPALVLAALALPWVALVALPSAGPAPGGTPVDDAALAGMLLGPSAAAATPPVDDAPSTAVRLAAAGRPERIVMPALDVDAPVEPISGSTGTLLPPADATAIGWWREGREPGAPRGAAVLTGHTVHTGGGAFDHLGRLRAGDTVLVRTARGWIRYAVQRTESYRKGRLAAMAPAIFDRTGPGRLVLVTCSAFDGSTYLANTVVYAVPVAATPVSG